MPLITDSSAEILNGLNGPSGPRYTYLVFYSNVVDGKMWCPHCVRVEDTIKNTFDGEDKPKAIIHYVGDRPEWYDDQNEARVNWKVEKVPTVLRIESGKETARLQADGILDQERWRDFVLSE